MKALTVNRAYDCFTHKRFGYRYFRRCNHSHSRAASVVGFGVAREVLVHKLLRHVASDGAEMDLLFLIDAAVAHQNAMRDNETHQSTSEPTHFRDTCGKFQFHI